MYRLTKKIWKALVLALFVVPVSANNLTISNASIVETNPTENYAVVQFDLSWENSFRTTGLTPDNWDAAWVFVKYRKANALNDSWRHCTLSPLANHVIPAGFEGVQPTDNLGVFIQRAETGSGTVTLTQVKLRWNLTAADIDPTCNIDIKVFGIEMVYVPQGTFKVGSGGTETGSFTDGSWTSGATIPFSITSEAAINMGPEAGKLWGTSITGNSTIGSTGVLPATFPKGFAAFYCMKHEITQQAYVDFLNTLSRAQQVARVVADISGTSITNVYVMSNTAGVINRNGVRVATPLPAAPETATFGCSLDGDATFGEDNDGQHLACGFLMTYDVYAWLDWAALRPMTELEYEKAGRGVFAPVPNEYAWGNTTIVKTTGITNGGTATETANEGQNCNYDNGVGGPLRVGFATGAATNRLQGGASFWGIFELSGNLWDLAISAAGNRNFTGAHGNGELTVAGLANVSDWPAGATAASRGGGAATQASMIGLLGISDRYNGSRDMGRWQDGGGRGVRTAQ